MFHFKTKNMIKNSTKNDGIKTAKQKKSKSSISVASQQYHSENQIEKDKITEDMANYFEERITNSDLIRWMASVNSDSKGAMREEVNEFLTNLGEMFLAELIHCATQKDRIVFLKTELIELFRFTGYDTVKRALSEIGISYLTPFATLGFGADLVTEFMHVYTTFLSLIEMYRDCEYHMDKLEKIPKAA
jgi:hypothetical protein